VHLLSISHYCDNRDYWEVIIVIQVFPLSHRPSAKTAHPHSSYIKRTKTPYTHSQGKPAVPYCTTQCIAAFPGLRPGNEAAQCEDEELPVYYGM